MKSNAIRLQGYAILWLLWASVSLALMLVPGIDSPGGKWAAWSLICCAGGYLVDEVAKDAD